MVESGNYLIFSMFLSHEKYKIRYLPQRKSLISHFPSLLVAREEAICHSEDLQPKGRCSSLHSKSVNLEPVGRLSELNLVLENYYLLIIQSSRNIC